MALKLINFFALTSLAVLATTFTATHANALATGSHQNLNRQVHYDVIARRSRFNNKKRQNNSTKRCKPRPSTSLSGAAVSTSSTVPVTSAAASSTPISEAQSHSSSAVAAPSSSSSAAPASIPSSTPSNGSRKVGLAWANGPTSDLQYYATDAVGW